MKKSLHINFRAHFGQAIADQVPERPKPSLNIRHAEKQYYVNQGNWAIAQEFDGKHGYLFAYDLWFEQAITIPVRVDVGDLHVVYLIKGNDHILIRDAAADLICTLAPGRARYLYVPPGDYHVELSAGGYQVFGFYFDGGIFRDGNERSFRFLQEVIKAYREQSACPVYSVDFHVGPRTLLHINYLCNNLKKGDFDNEAFILTELSRLVQLSKEKVFAAYEKIDGVSYTAQQAHRLIEEHCENFGQAFSVETVAEQLEKSPQYLSKVHKKVYGISLKVYKQQLILKKAQAFLRHQHTATQTAYHCGFDTVQHFCRFFKQQTGTTVSQYRHDTDSTHPQADG